MLQRLEWLVNRQPRSTRYRSLLQAGIKAGFPVAYLFDALGVSVERQLSLDEGRLSAGTLFLDILWSSRIDGPPSHSTSPT